MSALERQQLNAMPEAPEIPEPASTTTKLSQHEVNARLSGSNKVSPERQRQLRDNLHKNINALADEDYSFTAEA